MSRYFLSVLLFLVFTTTSFASSDLELQKVTPTVDLNDQILRVQIVISNRGPANSVKAHCRLSLYSGLQLVESLMYSLQPIALGESRQENLEWKITAPAANALGVELFDESEPDEYPFNNFVKLSLRFPGQGKADLEITDVILPAEQKLEGKTMELRIMIRNKGPLDVRSSLLKINLLQFQQPVAAMEKKLGKLESDQEKEIKIILRLPTEGIAVEQVLLEVRYEIQDTSIEELNLTNNIFSKTLLLSIRMPDLTIRNVRVDGRGNLVFWIVNRGTARSLPTVTALYVNGALVRRYNTPEMAGGRERRHLYGGTKIPQGTQIKIVADFNADLTESSEENNHLNFTAPLPPK